MGFTQNYHKPHTFPDFLLLGIELGIYPVSTQVTFAWPSNYLLSIKAGYKGTFNVLKYT